ncbi:FAD-dependent oxidoreductase [Mycobacterium sp. E740]|uniref:FAD-dependent oxidoreductase n=1 Tax=Mycobacterium sp. E740 TaxID=1834149 RepID=UPI0007FFECD0|nr:FAD-dependent oxidoreductase [Mycobacterium sp. E740]OBI74111.1 protoporphyrinogen oxidase [Mycobacterium sp. E740]
MGSHRQALIIGAGPAGLTAALELARHGVTVGVYEASGDVGGLARTPAQHGFRIDPGGHRFFTKCDAILELWRSLLPAEEWLSVSRRSAMLVDGHYVAYPLVGRNLLTQLGYRRGVRGLASFLRSRLGSVGHCRDDSASFREWGRHQFGDYWYGLFFDGYVRKTWLADPGQLTSDWAQQRIKPIVWRGSDAAGADAFLYPRRGPGQLWDAAAAKLADAGVSVAVDSPVVKVRFDGRRWTLELSDGSTATGNAVFSSMPLQNLIGALEPVPPQHIRAAAAQLKHRGLVTVAVALGKRWALPFNWVYTPGDALRVGRIQNYRLWSDDLTPPDWDGTYLGFEYFVSAGSDLCIAGDERWRTIVESDLHALGLDPATIEHVAVVRSQFAYPIYEPAMEESVARIRDYLRQHHPSLHPIGRNGMHRYDNQDHAMLSAMHSVKRYFGEGVDPWRVNTDRRYHESGLLNATRLGAHRRR